MLLFVMFALIPLIACGDIIIQGETLDAGKPNIITEKTPKTYKVTVDGELALTREIRNVGANIQLIHIQNEIVGVVKSLGKSNEFNHNFTSSQVTNLLQVVFSNEQTYIIIRSKIDHAVLRIICLDKNQPSAQIMR